MKNNPVNKSVQTSAGEYKPEITGRETIPGRIASLPVFCAQNKKPDNSVIFRPFHKNYLIYSLIPAVPPHT
ncbi:MAG: hypothetical protein U0L10_00905 [Lachnospiraceae bacterium]|nr:hypothetical protein [Lachnospiraceae bacterium]